MLDENLIATLEQSLRQTRNAQNRLLVRLREVESEAERLRQEIDALENSAAQTEAAIYSLLATMRSGQKLWNSDTTKIQRERERVERSRDDEDYEMPSDIKRLTRSNPPPNNNQSNSSNYYRGSNPVSYINNQHQQRVPSISQSIEPISHRFADRTITQACTLLLREAGKPLHVNELYNALVSGGMEFKGNNPTISIAVSLNRNRRFRKVAPGTFDLVMRDASQAVS
jgi:septal ring factor EnvC (AmiA/AmiB activator)